MPSASYIRKRREIQRKRAALGVAARRRIRDENASEMRIVGGMRTYGIFGDHHIEWLSIDSETHGYVRFDGILRRPLTPRGFVSMLGRWLWKQAIENN